MFFLSCRSVYHGRILSLHVGTHTRVPSCAMSRAYPSRFSLLLHLSSPCSSHTSIIALCSSIAWKRFFRYSPDLTEQDYTTVSETGVSSVADRSFSPWIKIISSTFKLRWPLNRLPRSIHTLSHLLAVQRLVSATGRTCFTSIRHCATTQPPARLQAVHHHGWSLPAK